MCLVCVSQLPGECLLMFLVLFFMIIAAVVAEFAHLPAVQFATRAAPGECAKCYS